MVDAAIGLLPALQAGFFQRRLFTQRCVCLMRRGHRLARRKPTLAGCSAAAHHVSVGHILQHPDLIATVPKRLADRLTEPFGLAKPPHRAGQPLVACGRGRLVQRRARR